MSTNQEPYILVADDDALVLKSLQFILQGAGYRVVTVADGAAAFEQLHIEKPRLALLDVMMPHLNGLDLCRRIKNDDSLRDITVFLVTARAMTAERERGLQAGADEYITKPFSNRDIIDKVAEVLSPSESSK
ncbi:MAG TPA: response regulator [Candidatus Krumholzibacteria bacterium]|nr:response regulator [Candidatus Krumholzibacteria bacterium]